VRDPVKSQVGAAPANFLRAEVRAPARVPADGVHPLASSLPDAEISLEEALALVNCPPAADLAQASRAEDPTPASQDAVQVLATVREGAVQVLELCRLLQPVLARHCCQD
jgi:hypothetical protein